MTVLSRLAQLFTPAKYDIYFWAFSGFWALPACLAMAIGITKDHYAGLHNAGNRTDQKMKLKKVRVLRRTFFFNR